MLMQNRKVCVMIALSKLSIYGYFISIHRTWNSKDILYTPPCNIFLSCMNYLNLPLLNNEELKILKKNINSDATLWEDGRKTAGSQAAQVKKNLQLKRDSDLSKQYSSLIAQKMLSIPLIKSFCLPKNIFMELCSLNHKKIGDRDQM